MNFVSSADRDSKVCVVGLGKLGLPLAIHFAKAGLNVTGVDIDEVTVSLANSGKARFEEPGLHKPHESSLKSGNFFATTDLSDAIRRSAYVVVVIPLYVDDQGMADFRNFDETVRKIGRSVQVGTTVVIETTLPIGTTRNRFMPILEEESGLECGKDFFLAFSPERVSSGTIFLDFARYPKIVGGVDAKSTKKAADLYRASFQFTERADLERPNGVWELETSESAEFTKLAETTYRDVNIALANVFATHANTLGLDFGEIRQAANSQPFSHVHQQGFSVGGHCIPVYPHFYLATDQNADLVRTAREENVANTKRLVDRALKAFVIGPNLPRVAVSGLSYRTGVKEHAFSGAKYAIERLRDHGIEGHLTDELFTPDEISQLGYTPIDEKSYDILIINSGTRNFQLSLTRLMSPEAVVLDGRGILESSDFNHVITP